MRMGSSQSLILACPRLTRGPLLPLLLTLALEAEGFMESARHF